MSGPNYDPLEIRNYETHTEPFKQFFNRYEGYALNGKTIHEISSPGIDELIKGLAKVDEKKEAEIEVKLKGSDHYEKVSFWVKENGKLFIGSKDEKIDLSGLPIERIRMPEFDTRFHDLFRVDLLNDLVGSERGSEKWNLGFIANRAYYRASEEAAVNIASIFSSGGSYAGFTFYQGDTFSKLVNMAVEQSKASQNSNPVLNFEVNFNHCQVRGGKIYLKDNKGVEKEATLEDLKELPKFDGKVRNLRINLEDEVNASFMKAISRKLLMPEREAYHRRMQEIRDKKEELKEKQRLEKKMEPEKVPEKTPVAGPNIAFETNSKETIKGSVAFASGPHAGFSAKVVRNAPKLSDAPVMTVPLSDVTKPKSPAAPQLV